MKTLFLTYLSISLFTLSSLYAQRLTNTRFLSLPLGKKVVGHCERGQDGITGVIQLAQVDSKAIAQLGESARIGPYQIYFIPKLKNRLEGIVDSNKGIIRCKVDKDSKNVHIMMGRLDQKFLLKELNDSVLNAIPWHRDIDVQDKEAKIKKDLKKKKYISVLAELKKLKEKREFSNYALIRAADTQVLAGNLPTAYVLYQKAHRRISHNGLRSIASARIVEIAYLVDKTQPRAKQVKILKVEKFKLSSIAKMRVARVLFQVNRLEEALGLTLNTKTKHSKKLLERIMLVHVRRSFFRGNHYEGVKVFEEVKTKKAFKLYKKQIYKWAAKNYLALDLPRPAIKLLQEILPLSQDMNHKEQILPLLAEAYISAGQLYRANQTINYYIGTLPSGPQRKLLQKLRASLRYESNNLKGALKDLEKMEGDYANNLKALVQLKLGQGQTLKGELWDKFKKLNKRHQEFLKDLEGLR